MGATAGPALPAHGSRGRRHQQPSTATCQRAALKPGIKGSDAVGVQETLGPSDVRLRRGVAVPSFMRHIEASAEMVWYFLPGARKVCFYIVTSCATCDQLGQPLTIFIAPVDESHPQ